MHICGSQFFDTYKNVVSMKAFPIQNAAECTMFCIPLEFPQNLVELRIGGQIPK